MMKTKNIYLEYAKYKKQPEPEFIDRYPEWKLLDIISDNWIIRLTFAAAYILFYIHFVPAGYEWLYILLPFHFLMGPVHGAIVNWCGHKYGYQNYNNDDHSKNTFPMDLLMMGELFQNNHHKSPNNANFAKKWFEFDPTYPVMRILNFIGIIKLRKA